MGQAWWLWLAGAAAIGLLELAVPGYLFLGFALGAAATGALLGLGLLGTGLPLTLVVFAALSILAWVAMRAALGTRRGQVRRFDRDINED